MGLVGKAVTKAWNPIGELNIAPDRVGWHRIGGSSTYGYYKSDTYDNAYPSISRIANAHMLVEPYAVDENGKRVSSNVLDRIYTPNKEMSAADFREALTVMTLVHNKVRLKVHHRTSRITADSITGFTFLEGAVEQVIAGKRYYQMPNGTRLDDSTVITLKGINPYDLNEGYSASKAAEKWATIDDYIAQYQQGILETALLVLVCLPSLQEPRPSTMTL